MLLGLIGFITLFLSLAHEPLLRPAGRGRLLPDAHRAQRRAGRHPAGSPGGPAAVGDHRRAAGRLRFVGPGGRRRRRGRRGRRWASTPSPGWRAGTTCTARAYAGRCQRGDGARPEPAGVGAAAGLADVARRRPGRGERPAGGHPRHRRPAAVRDALRHRHAAEAPGALQPQPPAAEAAHGGGAGLLPPHHPGGQPLRGGGRGDRRRPGPGPGRGILPRHRQDQAACVLRGEPVRRGEPARQAAAEPARP